MGEQTREKEAETWADFIREFLNEGGVIYESQEKQKGEGIWQINKNKSPLNGVLFYLMRRNKSSTSSAYPIKLQLLK